MIGTLQTIAALLGIALVMLCLTLIRRLLRDER